MPEYSKVDEEKITKFLSPYLNGGRAQEKWRLHDLEWRGGELRAAAQMESFFVSPTDTGFHLSNLTGLEIVAQLRIIHMHLFLRLEEKSKEVWFLSGSERCIKPIRDPHRIQIAMKSRFKAAEHGRMLVSMQAELTDKFGGNFVYKALTMI